MMRKIIATASLGVFLLIQFVIPSSAAAISIGTGNCVSTLVASSGSITYSASQVGSNCIVVLTPTTNATTSAGTWTSPLSNLSITYLVVGGGGSGSRGTCNATYGTGGGGGEVVSGSATVTGTLNLTLGAGGAASSSSCPNTAGNAGSSSIFNGVTARGGAAAGAGKTGGSSGNGNLGGTADDSGCGECGAGGGGGAGGAVNNSAAGTGTIKGMNGGAGVSSSITGGSIEYGSGGAGRSGTQYGIARGSGGSTNSTGGSGSCNGASGLGGGGSDCVPGWGAGGSGTVIISYSADRTPPSIVSGGSNNFAENTAITTNASTVVLSESSTVTLTAFNDSSLFTLITVDSVTVRIRFKVSPDYEAPSDSNTDNFYAVVIQAADSFGNTGNLTVNITVTNVNESSVISAPSIASNVYKGRTETITVSVNISGKVRFLVGGKRISTCLSQSTSGSYPNYTATCYWKPPVTGRQLLTATVTPTDNTFSTSTSGATTVWVVKRTNSR